MNLSKMEKKLQFLKELKMRGKSTHSDLIIPLPGETEESYFKGIEFLMNHNVQVGTYTLMMLVGAELGRDQAIKKYEIISRKIIKKVAVSRKIYKNRRKNTPQMLICKADYTETA